MKKLVGYNNVVILFFLLMITAIMMSIWLIGEFRKIFFSRLKVKKTWMNEIRVERLAMLVSFLWSLSVFFCVDLVSMRLAI